ncbi:Stk1 family PASTA domain-containing Ser/Thr kinase [Actinopolyspora mortivallis]|uniref:non-specific serine/threonine protein kinase n=1 Tax=Actinopolyspora mortivallis TaxID=33906 RepID=A0A2T0GTI5_ACTMO|nr:Stk1 family PASTA domain-containing Ser/Thr kinase [Actinopolyspora mortivallis]PRW62343.1 Stk1 family PASTA domain-containing Ser/Thr kinase [Actinopolyspora mortivallis]
MSSPRLLSNRYEIEDALGYGGMSEVHRGRDVRLGRDVAVKVLRADLARDPTFQLRFRREAQNAAALNHPAIVAVYDTGETDSENGPLPYIVMEYVSGRTLRDVVKSEGPLAPRRAMEVMADASAALDYSHRNGIVHRDVKPANIMITDSGAVKVMDFGIARAVANGQAAVTQTAAVIGTAQYLSPEQARGETVDARSDVYAAGCVLFELLCGQPPFTGDSPVAVAYQHVREQPDKPSEHNAQVPAALDAVVLKALSKHPDNRYQSAAEMRTDLVRVLSGQRPQAPLLVPEGEEPTERTEEPQPTRVQPEAAAQPDTAAVPPVDDGDDERGGRRRRRWTIGLVTVACVAAFALLSGLAVMMFGQQQPEKIELVDVTDKRVEVARSELSEAGFTKVTTEKRSSAADKDGIVLSQDPGPGRYVPDRKIVLEVGAGPGKVEVPDLGDMTMEEARQALEKRNLKLGLEPEYQEVDDQSDVGRILEQSEEPGSMVPEGRVVHVTVGEPVQKQPVTDVTGFRLEQAKRALTSADFKVRTKEVDSPETANTVVRQNPAGGASAPVGSTVTLFVSNGSQLNMPDLTGLSPEKARAELRDKGFRGNVSTAEKPVEDPSKEDTVVSTSPSAGSTIDRNQDVTLHVGTEADTTTPPPQPSTSEDPDFPF